MDDRYVLVGVLIATLVTVGLKTVPFAIFGEKRNIPPVMKYLGEALPFATIGMLVVYGLKDISFRAGNHGVPEILACGVVILLHLWKKNTILSISVGTVLYMLMVQFIS